MARSTTTETQPERPDERERLADDDGMSRNGGGFDGGRRDDDADDEEEPERVTLLQIHKTFSALQIPAYRLLWLSMLFGFLGMQMQMVARGILAFEIGGTNSAIAVVTVGWGIPMLFFSLLGGTIADRFDKRRLMIITQAGTAVGAIIIAVLVQTDLIRLEYLFISGLFQGTLFAFGGPARQALIPEVVGEKELMNGIALNSAGMNLSRILGPSIAGVLVAIPFVDIAGVFYFQAVLYVVSLVLLMALPRVQRSAIEAAQTTHRWGRSWRKEEEEPRGSVRSEMVNGLRYIAGSPILFTLLLMALIPTMLGMAYQNFLPVFAKDVFGDGVDRNSQGLGFMMTMTGVGALLGSLFVASMQDYPRRTQLQLIAGLGFGADAGLLHDPEQPLPRDRRAGRRRLHGELLPCAQ